MSETWIGEIEEKLDAADATLAGITKLIAEARTLVKQQDLNRLGDLIAELFARYLELPAVRSSIRNLTTALIDTETQLGTTNNARMKTRCAEVKDRMYSLQLDCRKLKDQLVTEGSKQCPTR